MASERLRALKRASRLRVESGRDSYVVLRIWPEGFSVEADAVPPLRGVVDLFDGPDHLSRCLVVATDAEAGEMRYEFKRSTKATDRAPLDFFRETPVPLT
jgi:hypothetical protein